MEIPVRPILNSNIIEFNNPVFFPAKHKKATPANQRREAKKRKVQRARSKK